MRKNNKQCLLYVICFMIHASCFMIHASNAYAQEVKLSISPPLVSVVVKPGKSLLIAYDLTNQGDPVEVSSYVLPFLPTAKSGEIAFGNSDAGPITFNLENSDRHLNEPFFLQTGESQQLLLKIAAPANTPDGDYYYSFLSESKAPGGEIGA